MVKVWRPRPGILRCENVVLTIQGGEAREMWVQVANAWPWISAAKLPVVPVSVAKQRPDGDCRCRGAGESDVVERGSQGGAAKGSRVLQEEVDDVAESGLVAGTRHPWEAAANLDHGLRPLPEFAHVA